MLNPARFTALHAGLTSIAQKVYTVVPIAEAWGAGQIHAELKRSTGSAPDRRVLDGCLRALIDSGLVAQPEIGAYVRVAVKPPKSTRTPTEKGEPMPTSALPAPTAATERKGPSAALTAILARARTLSSSMRELADEIEIAAMEIDEQVARTSEDSQKLKQLQQLLKGLSDGG